MLLNGVVLTAGHCVYSNYRDGVLGEHTGFRGYYNPSTYYVVPGNTWTNGGPYFPFGSWRVRTMWTTNDYKNGLLGADWGIIELKPNARGQYPGEVGINNFRVMANQPTIDNLYSAGYPTSGAFGQLRWFQGNRQYFCETHWTPTTDAEVDPTNFGSGYYGLVIQPCAETGGASGGPVLTDVNGGWRIIGVNNRGPGPNAQGVATYILSFYFNGRFAQFWSDVMGQIDSGV